MKFMVEGREWEFQPQKLIIAGYTGRDQQALQRHIEELKKIGVPAPEKTPTYFAVPVDRLTTGSVIEVLEATSSGEPEAVLFYHQSSIYVGVGSDHTDREIEKTSIPLAKVVTPKPVSYRLWSYSRIKDRWDDLVLRSWVGKNGRERLYQEGKMKTLLPPETLLQLVKENVKGDINDSVIFCGTVPMIEEKIWYEGYFEAELFDPVSGESLTCPYVTKKIDYLRG